MSGLFEQQQQTEEVDNLSEYRTARFAFYQQSIDAEYATFKIACDAVKSSSVRMCELLRGAQQERVWSVDGYGSMTHWVQERWPEISKVRLSQFIAGGAILEEFDQWAADELTNTGNLLTLPRPEHEGQLRAMKAVDPENRRSVYELASESANGHAPSAQQITDTYSALNGKPPTDERISRLDTDRTTRPPQPPVQNPASHRRAWCEDVCVQGRYLQFFTCDVPWTNPQTGKVRKTHIFTGMKLVQIAEAGFVHRNDADGLRNALKRAEELERQMDREDEEAAAQKSLGINQDEEPLQGSFIGNGGIAAEAMAKLFADEGSQDTPQ